MSLSQCCGSLSCAQVAGVLLPYLAGTLTELRAEIDSATKQPITATSPPSRTTCHLPSLPASEGEQSLA